MASDITKEYLDALERLKNNSPNDLKLKRKAKLGTLKISIATVAQEARRSRTAIATKDTRYPEVRERILEEIEPVIRINTSAGVIKKLRQKNADLFKENKLIWTENANLIREIGVLRQQLDRLKKAQKRTTKRSSKIDNTVVPLFDPS